MDAIEKLTLSGLVLAAVVVFVVLPVNCAIGFDRGYSEGERTGVVVKFSRKGLLIKSWEGTMNLGGMSGGSNTVPNTWDFTVTDHRFISEIQSALESGRPVTIKYIQWLLSPIRMDSDYEVVRVKTGGS